MSIFRKIVNFIVQDVPVNLAACEDSCSEVDCSQDKFARCERRIAVVKQETMDDDEANQEEATTDVERRG